MEEIFMDILVQFVSELAQELLWPALLGLIGLVGAFVQQKIKEIKVEIAETDSDELRWALERAATRAVQFVEQVFKSKEVDGAVKFEEAMKAAQVYLDNAGFEVDVDILRMEIERQVLILFGKE
jgi:hypothetical protein